MSPSASTPHFGEFLAAAAAAHNEPPQVGADTALGAPGEGFVYLTASSAMPGFVQLARCSEDPRGLSWSLKTFSGVTHFRTICAVRTCDAEALEARFREVVGREQIPHHDDLFNVPARFAR